MSIFFYVSLFIFWCLFWSFSSVIIHRLKKAEWWILLWRSHCFKCNKLLKFIDLIPIFSFLFSFWKCRYCKTKIPSIYPILELSTWILFSLIWYFLIDFNLILELNTIEIIKLFYWLTIWFISILYIYYDILFLEIHEWIMLSGIIFSIIWILLNSLWIPILETLSISNNFSLSYFISIIILLFGIWLFYIIMLKELDTFLDFIILASIPLIIFLFKHFFQIESLGNYPFISALIWAYWIFLFFYLQIFFSAWKALWGGDLRIWIMVWLILWISYSFIWMLLTYLVWSIISIIFIIYKKLRYKNKKISTIIPFWPFIAIWFFLTIFFLNDIQKIVEIYFYSL